MFWLLSIFITIFSLWLLLRYESKSRKKRKPSLHYDGKRFHNPIEKVNPSLWKFLQWQAKRKRTCWPRWVELKHFDKPPQRVSTGSLRVSFVNHSTVLIQTEDLNILTDPVWSVRPSPVKWVGPRRVHAPGIHFEDLPPIDIVLISHNHYDHLDMPTLRRLYHRDKPRVLVGLGVEKNIWRRNKHILVEPMDWGDSIQFPGEVKINFRPLQHWSGRLIIDKNKTLWGGYAIQTPHGTVYFAGDTSFQALPLFVEDAEQFGPIRLAILPISPLEPRWYQEKKHMGPEEAVKTHLAMQAAYSIPMHFGTFKQGDDAYEEPIYVLDNARRAHGVSEDEFRLLKPGEHWYVPAVSSNAHIFEPAGHVAKWN